MTNVSKSSSTALFVRAVASGTIAKLITAVVKFGSQIIFARLLGPGAYGSYHLLLSIVHVVDWPISGWSDATKKRLSDGRIGRGEVISALLLVELVFLVVASSLGYLLRGAIVKYTQVDSSPLLLALLLLHTLIFYPLLGIILSQERIGKAMWTETGQGVLASLIQVYLLYSGLGISGLVIGVITSTITIALLLHRTVPSPAFPTRETFQSLWDYAKFASVSKLLGKGYDRFDVLLIGALLGPASVGYYEAAAVLSAPALLSSNVISSGIMPTISRLESADSSIKESASTALQLSPLLAVPVFFGSLVLADRLVRVIFGPSFLDGSILLPGIALYYILKSISSPLSEIINGLDKPEYNAAITAVTLLVNLILGVILVIYVGVIGAVIATIISESIRLGYLTRIAGQKGLQVFSRVHVVMVVASAIMVLSIILYEQFFAVKSQIELAAVILLGAGIYFAIVLSLSTELRRILSESGLLGE